MTTRKKEEKEEKLINGTKSRRVTRASVFRCCVTAEIVDPAALRLTPEAAATGDTWCWLLGRVFAVLAVAAVQDDPPQQLLEWPSMLAAEWC